MKKALAYCRVSRPEHETESHSLRMQEEKIRQYAPFAGLEIVDFFIDDGVSGGKPLDTRPEGAKLMQTLAETDVEAVVALRLDRLFRDTLDALNTMKALDEMDISTHFVDFGGQPFDSTSAVGRLFFLIQVGFAEFERGRIAERIRENKASRRAAGRTHSVAAFGMDNVEGRIVPNEEELDILFWMQEQYAEGVSYHSLAKQLNAREVPTKQYGSRWYASSVKSVLERARRAEEESAAA
jgi:DNA invertase Pin-like site-specific DNA recombinase